MSMKYFAKRFGANIVVDFDFRDTAKVPSLARP